VYILFAINLYNILNLASPTEVILNALALEFVFKIDEKYATADWWDPCKYLCVLGQGNGVCARV